MFSAYHIESNVSFEWVDQNIEEDVIKLIVIKIRRKTEVPVIFEKWFP